MPFPVRNQGYSRKSRVRSPVPPVLSSAALLSRLTLVSNSSGGSGSTITQESFDRALRSKTKGQGRDGGRKSSKRRRKTTPPDTSREQFNNPVDVFAFLEAGSTGSTSKRQSNTGSPEPELTTLFYDSDHESNTKSWHSDSGISMGGSPTENVHSDGLHSTRLPSLAEEQIDGDGPSKASHVCLDQTPPPCIQGPSYSPPGARFTWPNQLESSSTGAENFQRSNAAAQPQPRKKSDSSLSGYDLLASKLSSNSATNGLVPCYRRFDKLSHRILLQLQDEIAEMEVHLTYLDEEDTRLREFIGDAPASRRMDWTWHHSPVHARRLELLAKIHHKMQQYGDAISLHQKIRSCTNTVDHEALLQYRKWLHDTRPLSDIEMRYLDDEFDVVALHGQPTTQHPPPPLLRSNLVAIFCATTVPLMFFKISANIFLRLLSLGIVSSIASVWREDTFHATPEIATVWLAFMASAAMVW